MELNIDELEPYEKNYWELSKNAIIEKKKKKVSFDDILTNMNLIVNEKGQLQQMIPKNFNSNISNYDNEYNNLNISNQQSIPNIVNQSYIYNKYFKDYNRNIELNNKQSSKIPRNIKEYKIMVLQEKIKYIAERKRINEIKPKKLLFSSNGIVQPNIRSYNNLRKLNFS